MDTLADDINKLKKQMSLPKNGCKSGGVASTAHPPRLSSTGDIGDVIPPSPTINVNLPINLSFVPPPITVALTTSTDSTPNCCTSNYCNRYYSTSSISVE